MFCVNCHQQIEACDQLCVYHPKHYVCRYHPQGDLYYAGKDPRPEHKDFDGWFW